MAAVDELRQLIQRDRESGGRRYPEQAQFVLDDERLVQLLERRFEQGEQLRRIYELDYQVSLGLIPIVIELTPTQGNLPGVTDVLVLVGGDCHVAAIQEQFDWRQPNPLYPPMGVENRPPYVQGDLPFVISRPSTTFGHPDPADALLSYQDRIRKFLDRYGLREIGSPAGKETGCVVGTDVYCAGGVWDVRADHIADDSGPDMP